MLDGLKNGFFNLAYFAQRIFFKLFDSENFINIFTKVHPFNSFLSAVDRINTINLDEFFVFIFRQVQVHAAKNSSKLMASHIILSETVKVNEKFTNSKSFQGNLGLNFLQKILDRLGSFRKSFFDIKLLS